MIRTKAKKAVSEAWATASHWRMDNRGQATGATGAAVNVIVALTVGGLVAAFLLPIALDEIVAVDVTAYSDGAQSLWNILDLVIVLAAFLYFIQVAMDRSQKV